MSEGMYSNINSNSFIWKLNKTSWYWIKAVKKKIKRRSQVKNLHICYFLGTNKNNIIKQEKWKNALGEITMW